MNNGKRGDWAIAAALVGILLALPLIGAFYSAGDHFLTNILAADSMYYMAIANNYARYGIPTMDGAGATNGFHPLWGYLLMVAFKFSGVSHDDQIWLTFFLSAFFVYIAYAMLSYFLIDIGGRSLGIIATLALIPGIYALAIEPRRHSFGDPGVLYSLSPISAMNGMETPLSLLLWVGFLLPLIARILDQQEKHGEIADLRALFPLGARIILGAIMLTRLDDVFWLASLGLFVLAQTQRSLRERVRALLHIFWPALVMLYAYMAYNKLTVGVVTPVSVSGKLTFTPRWDALRLYWSALLGRRFEPYDWWIVAARVYPIIFSLADGIAAIASGWRFRTLDTKRGPFNIRGLLLPLGLYMVLKPLFLVLSLHIMDTGYWYYFTFVIIGDMLFAVLLIHTLRRHGPLIRPARLFFAFASLLTVPNAISYLGASSNSEMSFNFSYPYRSEENLTYSEVEYQLWKHGGEIRSYLEREVPGAKLIDNIDGAFAFFLEMPAETISGLALSYEAVQARRGRNLWDGMVERGFAILPGFGYGPVSTLPPTVRIAKELHPPGSPFPYYLLEMRGAQPPPGS